MNACERISSARGAWHPIAGPVRGLARALNDDIDGAIKDFQAIVDWTDWTGAEELKLEYQRWLDVLHAGENPFTPEELERLRRRYLSFE